MPKEVVQFTVLFWNQTKQPQTFQRSKKDVLISLKDELSYRIVTKQNQTHFKIEIGILIILIINKIATKRIQTF